MNRALRIGVDARVLAEPAPKGVARYVSALLRSVTELAPQHEFFLYFRDSMEITDPFLHAPFFPRVLTKWKGIGASLLWQQVFFPWHAWRDRVDVVLLPFYNGLFFTPAPQVIMLHDISFSLFPHEFPSGIHFKPKLFARPTSRLAARVVTISEFSRQEIARTYKLPPSKIIVIPPGNEEHVGWQTHPPVGRIPMQLPMPFFLFVGSFHPRRHVAVAVQALAQLPPHFHLLCVGEQEPSRLARLEESLRQQHMTERVHCLGHISDEDLHELYLRAVALISPSRYEGFGLPVLEAMSRGVPIIAWDIPVMHEVAGEAAVLVPCDDTAALAAAMQRLGTQEPARRALSEAGRVRSHAFSWPRSARIFLSLLQEVAHNNRC